MGVYERIREGRKGRVDAVPSPTEKLAQREEASVPPGGGSICCAGGKTPDGECYGAGTVAGTGHRSGWEEQEEGQEPLAWVRAETGLGGGYGAT